MARATAHTTSPQVARASRMRRTARLTARFGQVLAAMRDEGKTLHLQFSDGGPLWSLSDGSSVTADVAALILNHACIEPTSHVLFPGVPAQTWSFTNDN
jgi:hypothetical protein